MTGEHTTDSEISLPARRRRRAVPNWSRHPAPPAPKPISQLLAERDFAARVATLDPTPSEPPRRPRRLRRAGRSAS